MGSMIKITEYADKKPVIDAKMRENKVIIMAVDPGYDSYKIVINGEYVTTMPSLALHPELNERVAETVKRGETTSVTMKNADGEVEEFILGSEVADILAGERLSKANKALIKASEEKEKRFSTDGFKASFVMAVIRALHEYASEKNSVDFKKRDIQLTEWRLALVIAVPAAFSKASRTYIDEIFKEKFDAEVSVGTVRYHLTDFNFNLARPVLYTSQVLSAYNNFLFSPFGTTRNRTELEDIINESPSLVLDFGRKTFGAAVINSNLQVEYGQELDIDPNSFAMLRFETEVADIINEQYGSRLRKPVMPASVGMYCDGEDRLYAYKENGRGADEIRVHEIRRKVIEKHMPELIAYIDKKFDILNIHSIAVCGGTGSILLEEIQKAYNWRDYSNIKTVRPIDVYGAGMVYAVAFGAYSELAVKLNHSTGVFW